MIKVTYFQRKPYDFHFSIEKLFDTIRAKLPNTIKCKIHISPNYSQGFFPRLKNLIVANKDQGDVNHITGDIYYIALALKKNRTIITYHDLNFMDHPNPILRWFLKQFWVKLPIIHSKLITAISESTKNEILKYVPDALNKIVVIPDVIHSGFVAKPKEFNCDNPTILHIGTKYNKNLENLIIALKGINCKLHIIGKLTNEQFDLLKRNQITWINEFDISELELIKCYESCDILSFCSTKEGFGMPIIEAQAVGRVVITSNCSSMPEVARGSALLVDPYDTSSIREGFLNVIKNSELRDTLIEKGFDNIKRFSIKNVTEEYCKLYESIVKQNTDAL